MRSFRFNLGDSTPVLSEMFSGIPSEAKDHLRLGFSILAKLPDQQYDNLISILGGNLVSGATKKDDQNASQLGISPQEVNPLLAAAMFASFTLATQEVTAEEFVKEATEADVIRGEDTEAALEFSTAVIKARPALKQALDQSRASAEGLPSLTNFEMTVDIRLGFESNGIAFGLPIILVHIDTDSYEQEIWFQITKGQLERMIEDQQDTLKRVKNAEKWAERNLES